MERSKPKKVPLEDRRGLFLQADNRCLRGWETILIQLSGRTGPVDLDEVVERLLARRVIGSARRGVQEDVFTKKVPPPSGAWALLVALPGQPWAYLVPGFEAVPGASRCPRPDELATRAGVRVIAASCRRDARDRVESIRLLAHEEDETLVRFETQSLKGEVVDEPDGFEVSSGRTLFCGTRHPKSWLDPFKTPFKVVDALARDLDAFIPELESPASHQVGIRGRDESQLRRFEFRRIDLIGFGDARLEPAPADVALGEAIDRGDVAAVRSAVAAGASLRHLPVEGGTPLGRAIRQVHPSEVRLALVSTLLDLGADPGEGDRRAVSIPLVEPAFTESEAVDVLDVLAARGVDVAAGFLGWTTPLHIAAERGWLAVAKLLIAFGADPNAKDDAGMTPRRKAMEMRRGFKRQNPENAEATYGPIIAFLKAAEAGRRLDLDWRAAAEESRRQGRPALPASKAELFLQSLEGRLAGRQATAGAPIEAVPDEISLEPIAPAPSSEAAAALLAEGFESIGRFAIAQAPAIRVEALHHPGEALDAAVYHGEGRTSCTIVRYDRDGSRLVVTNTASSPEPRAEAADTRSIHLPDALAADLLAVIRAEPDSPGGLADVSATGFIERFETAYRRAVRARNSSP